MAVLMLLAFNIARIAAFSGVSFKASALAATPSGAVHVVSCMHYSCVMGLEFKGSSCVLPCQACTQAHVGNTWKTAGGPMSLESLKPKHGHIPLAFSAGSCREHVLNACRN